MALKPVPKAILIIAVVSAAGYAFTKFMPKAPVDNATSAPATVVTPPTQDQVDSAAVTAPTPSAPTMTPATEAPRPNVTTGDAGLSAVIGAGR